MGNGKSQSHNRQKDYSKHVEVQQQEIKKRVSGPKTTTTAAASVVLVGAREGDRNREKGVVGIVRDDDDKKHDAENVSKRSEDKKKKKKKVKIARYESVDGWPKWLIDNIPKYVLDTLVPKSADSYEKLDKVGRGTHSNIYKARDKDTGKIVALKKVRVDTSDSESIKFIAREIMILQMLDHPNVLKLEGLATSRMQYSLYLVFDYMQPDLQSYLPPWEKTH